jgi:signal transduction histidine kinase
LLAAQTGFVAALLLAVIAVSHSARGQGRRQDDRLVIFAANLGFVHLFSVTAALSSYGLWPRLMWIAAGITPITASAFLRSLVGNADRGAVQTGRFPAALFAIATSVLALTPWLIEGGIIPVLVGSLLLGMHSYLIDMIRRAANVTDSPISQARLRLLWAGASLCVGLTALDLVTGRQLIGLGEISQVLYTGLLSASLLRERLLDLQDLIARGLIFGLLVLLLTVLYGVLVFPFYQDGETFLFASLVSSAILLLLINPVTRSIENLIMRLMLADTQVLTEACYTARDRIRRSVQARQMMDSVVTALMENSTVTRVAIYLTGPMGLSFNLKASGGPTPQTTLEVRDFPEFYSQLRGDQASLSRSGIQRQLSRRTEWIGPVNAENDPEIAHLNALEEGLTKAGADLLLPVSSQGQVLGLLSVGDDRRPEGFTRAEAAALSALAGRLGIGISNTQHMEQLRFRDRLAALGEMSAGLAHEIRNPLGSIQGAVQMLEDELPLDEEQGELFDIITNEVRHLSSVVQGFLDYSRPLNVKAEAVDMVEFLDACAQVLAGSPTIEVNQTMERAWLDRDRILQVLRNLVNNAREADPENEPVISCHDSSLGTVIEIIDQGPGIPDEQKSKLFTPFFTTKDRGTGLGLAICQQITKAHGGRLDLLTNPGGGTIARITLPKPREGQAKGAVPQPPSKENAAT